MKEINVFRDIAARLNKYGIDILQDIQGVYGLPESSGTGPDIIRGKRFAIRQDGNKFTVHRLDEWKGRAMFGKSLQAARLRLGLSVEEVAELVDYKPSTIRLMEGGRFSFSIDQAARVADVLKCDISLTPR